MSGASAVEFVARAETRRKTSRERDVEVLLTARLSDGREVVVLSDRGWESSLVGHLSDADSARLLEDDELETCAWVVGPDGRFGDYTDRDMAEHHWSVVASKLSELGVDADASSLMALPFRVVWGDREKVWPNGFGWW